MLKHFIFTIIFLLLPFSSQAATIYLESDSQEYHIGDEFRVDIMVDKVGECFNTAEIEIDFPKDILNFINFSDGESLLSLWLEKPNSDNIQEINKLGRLKFTGGIPGGYCGKIPGDPGVSNKLGAIFFKAKNVAEGVEISIDNQNSKILLNDGQGSFDNLKVKNLKLDILEASSTSKNEWKELLKKDKIPPEPFVVELRQNPNMFDGAYYIIFSTTDKQSGIDHYEVLEIKLEEQLGIKPKRSFWDIVLGRKKKTPKWEKVESIPYKLKDQSLESIIKVKAVDKAGNERVVEYVPPADKRPPKHSPFIDFKLSFLLIIGAVVLILVVVLLERKQKRYK